MKEGENCHTEGSFHSPPVGRQKRKKLSLIGHFNQLAGLQIGHQDNGNYNLVGGKAQYKSGQDHAVHTQKLSKWFKKAGEPGEQAQISDVNIG